LYKKIIAVNNFTKAVFYFEKVKDHIFIGVFGCGAFGKGVSVPLNRGSHHSWRLQQRVKKERATSPFFLTVSLALGLSAILSPPSRFVNQAREGFSRNFCSFFEKK